MRLAGVAAALALLAGGGGPSWALNQDRIAGPTVGGTVPVTPLGPDEVLLELHVTGVSNLPAEVTTVSIPITRVGATPAAARAAVAAEADRIVAGARRAGIEPRDIQVVPRDDPRMGFLGLEPDALMAFSGLDGAAQKRRHVNSTTVDIVLRDPMRFEPLRNALETAETVIPTPVYSLRDPARGEREAKADALRRARAEAEDFARSTGMRVGRLVRIGAEHDSDSSAMLAMIRMGSRERAAGTVETKLSLAVDYALVPETAGAPKR